MNVAIIGAGNWGTTFALYLNGIGHNVTLYEYFKERADKIRNDRENKIFLPGYPIPDEIGITSDIKDAVENKDIVVYAIPSRFMDKITSLSSEYDLGEAITVSLSKGIEEKTLRRISQIISDNIPQIKDRIVVLSGPSIAREVVKKVPSTLVAASVNHNIAKIIQREFSSDYIRIYTTGDITGVELGGSLKNVYAIAAGICDGLRLGMNAKAALLTRALAEMKRLGIKMGGSAETFNGLSGTGDLIVTSFSKYSRNRHVGEEIGKGKSLDEIMGEMTEVAEGIHTVKSVIKLSKKYNVDVPIANEVYNVLYNNKSPSISILHLMRRELKEED